MTPEREDILLGEAFDALGPSSERVAEMERRLFAALEVRDALSPPKQSPVRALAAEWLELLRTRPVANGALVAAAALVLALTSPLALLPFALLG